jgi:hypothetical protein
MPSGPAATAWPETDSDWRNRYEGINSPGHVAIHEVVAHRRYCGAEGLLSAKAAPIGTGAHGEPFHHEGFRTTARRYQADEVLAGSAAKSKVAATPIAERILTSQRRRSGEENCCQDDSIHHDRPPSTDEQVAHQFRWLRKFTEMRMLSPSRWR